MITNVRVVSRYIALGRDTYRALTYRYCIDISPYRLIPSTVNNAYWWLNKFCDVIINWWKGKPSGKTTHWFNFFKQKQNSSTVCISIRPVLVAPSLQMGSYGTNFMDIAPSGGQYWYQEDLFTGSMASFANTFLSGTYRWPDYVSLEIRCMHFMLDHS